jgi:hypothetical protein
MIEIGVRGLLILLMLLALSATSLAAGSGLTI